MYWNDAAWWAWIPMTITMIVLWGLVAWVAVRLVDSGRRTPEPPARDARAMLDARLAAGEITRDEYEEVRRLLATRE